MSDTDWQKGTLYLPAKVCQDFANRAMVPPGVLAAHERFVCKVSPTPLWQFVQGHLIIDKLSNKNLELKVGVRVL